MEGARPAHREDLPRLIELLEQAVEETTPERAGHLFGFPARFSSPSDRLTSALDDAEQLVLAGLIEEHIVGLALVSLDFSLPGGTVAQIEELFVEPPAREVGVGEALLDTVVEWARDTGCTGVDIQVSPGARSAKNLCERSNFTARVLVMHRRL